MASLKELAESSPLMEFDITYNGVNYKFNLAEESKITPTNLNNEIKRFAPSYSFITQLRDHLEYQLDKAEATLKRVEAKLYIDYKNEINTTTNRVNSDDVAKALVYKSKRYKELLSLVIETRHQYRILRSACIAYEKRGAHIQSLGANIRNEK